MDDNQIKLNFAKNLRLLRTKHNLTQEQLGEKLGYTDKAVSKWECGSVVPDIYTLIKISELFSVSLNDLIGQKLHLGYTLTSRISLIIGSVFILVVFIASVLFFVLSTFTDIERCYLIYIYSIPVFTLTSLVLVCVYFGYKQILVMISAFILSIAITIYLAFLSENYWLIFIIAALAIIFVMFIGFIIRVYKVTKRYTQNKTSSIE